MIFLLVVGLVKACNYKISPGSDCIGEDTRTVLGEFSMVWVWITLTVFFVFGMIISIIRDILPRHTRENSIERYPTGESKDVVRFLMEEYLVSGWVISKKQKRFTNTARFCLIMVILYTEMFITGALYQRNYKHYDDIKHNEVVYGFSATVIAFVLYLCAYFLLVVKEDVEMCNWRLFFGYAFTAAIFIVCIVFVYVFTYQLHDDTVDYSDVVTEWLKAYGISLLFEFLISENIRIITRAIILWTKRLRPEEPVQTNIELSSMDRSKNIYEVSEFE